MWTPQARQMLLALSTSTNMKKLLMVLLALGFISVANAQSMNGGVNNPLFKVSNNIITPVNPNWTYGGTVTGVGGSDINWTWFNGSGIALSTTTNQVLIAGASTSTLAALEVKYKSVGNGSILALGSTTLQNFTATNSTTTNATTTNFISTSATTTNLAINGLSVYPIIATTTASLGGGLLTAGSCASVQATTTQTLTTSMVVNVTPTTYPGDGTSWDAFIGPNNTVTVKVCVVATLTPTASTYNIRIIQ